MAGDTQQGMKRELNRLLDILDNIVDRCGWDKEDRNLTDEEYDNRRTFRRLQKEADNLTRELGI